MPRLVRLNMNGPIKIDPQEKAIFVCGCGLSKTFPFCDGSHKKCRETEPDLNAVYVYDDARNNIVETRREGGSGAANPGSADACDRPA